MLWRGVPARTLTLLRVLGIGPFAVLLVRTARGEGSPSALVVSYVAIAASDYFDGALARRFGAADPRWGRIDAAADITFNLCSLAVAAALGLIGGWVPAGVAVLGARFARRSLRRGSGVVEDPAGKIAGVVFYLLVGAVVTGVAVGFPPRPLLMRLGDAVFAYSLYALWRGRAV